MVSGREGVAARLTVPSRVLAHNEWQNSPALYDSLAAVVQPNTDSVNVVLRANVHLSAEANLGNTDGLWLQHLVNAHIPTLDRVSSSSFCGKAPLVRDAALARDPSADVHVTERNLDRLFFGYR